MEIMSCHTLLLCVILGLPLSMLTSAAVVNLHAWQPLCVEDATSCGWPVGNSMQVGALVMMDRINSAGFLKSGHTLNFTIFDTHCSGIWGLQRATYLIMKSQSEWPFAVMGCGCSGCTMNAQPILRTAMIPMISQSATSPSLSDRAKYPAFFRFWPTDDVQIDAMLELFHYLNFTTFAMVYDEAYGAGFVSHFRFRLSSYKGAMTDVLLGNQIALVDKGTQDEIRQVLQKIVQTRVRAIMVLFYENYVRSWACAEFKMGIRGMIKTTFGWFAQGWDKVEIPECKVSEYQLGLDYVHLPVSTPWADKAVPVPCGPADYTTGAFIDEVNRRLDLEGWKPSGGEGFNADAVCFIATAWNKMLDHGYTVEDLVKPNKITYDALAATMQGIRFQGVSGYVSFASDGTQDKSGDRQGSFTFEQIVNGTTEKPWGTFSANEISLFPGQAPLFDQGFTWPANPPPMAFPECPGGQVFKHKDNKCVGCPENKVYADSAGLCVCIAGFFESGNGCRMCGNGTISTSVGSLRCIECEPGKFAPSGIPATECTFCARGTYAPNHGMARCSACPVGMTTENIASAAVAACVCDVGFFVSQKACVQCPRNSTTLGIQSASVSSCRCKHDTYMSSDMASCILCPALSSTVGDGKTCMSSCGCSRDTYMSAEMTSCEACPLYSSTKGDRKTSIFSCLCKEGTYLPAGRTDACVNCITGMDCPVGSSAAHFPSMVTSTSESTYPRLKARQWASKDDPMSIFTCKTAYQCPGGAPETCGPDLSGRRCSECPEDWHWTGFKCVQCSSVETSKFMFPALPILIGPIIILVLYRISRDPVEKWGSWRNGIGVCVFICLNHYQIIVLLSSSTIDLPSALTDSFDFWTFLEAPLTIFKQDCAGYTSFESSMIFQSVGPIVIAMVFLITFAFSCSVGMYVGQDYRLNGNMMFNIFMSVIFTFFGAIASMAMSLFKCNDNPNGKTTLASDLRIICGSDTWSSMLAVGISSFVLYVVCCGSLFVWIIIIAPHRFSDDRFQKQWKFLFLKYRPDVWWWSLAFLIKNLLYNLAFVIFSNAVAQFFSSIIISFAYLSLVIAFHPFRHLILNALDILACASLILNAAVLACLAFRQGDGGEESGLSMSAAVISFSPIGVGILFILWMMMRGHEKIVRAQNIAHSRFIRESARFLAAMTETESLELVQHLGQWDEWYLMKASNIVHAEVLGMKRRRITDGKIVRKLANSLSGRLQQGQDPSPAAKEPAPESELKRLVEEPAPRERSDIFDDVPWEGRSQPHWTPRISLASTPRKPRSPRLFTIRHGEAPCSTPRTPR